MNVGLRGNRKEVDGNESRNVIRSERTVAHPTSKVGPGSPCSCREFGGAGEQGTSSDFLCDHGPGRPQETR